MAQDGFFHCGVIGPLGNPRSLPINWTPAASSVQWITDVDPRETERRPSSKSAIVEACKSRRRREHALAPTLIVLRTSVIDKQPGERRGGRSWVTAHRPNMILGCKRDTLFASECREAVQMLQHQAAAPDRRPSGEADGTSPLVTSLAAVVSTDPLRETRSLDAVAGFLPVKRWVKKSPGGDDGAGE